MNENLKPITSLRPFTRFCMTIGALPTSYLMTMTYEEQLIWLCNYLAETVIPTLNNNGLAIEELQTKYIELKSYVDNYFEDLDVQEEINNKLDEMADDGTLEAIISEYLQLATTYVYDTVNDMKEATNLINGSFARTSGYYSYNDGGGAYYKVRTITNEDVVDEMFIIALNDNTLIAELVLNQEMLNVKQVGIKGLSTENVTDELTILFAKSLNLYFPSGTYVVSSPLTLTCHKLYGDTTGETIIKYEGETHNELINSYDLVNVEIKYITFDLGSVKDRLKTSINLYSTTNLLIANCEFKNGYGGHMRLHGSDTVTIENCNFHDITGDEGNMGNCIYCHPVNNLTIRNCKCNNIMEDFLYLDGASNDPVKNVYVTNCFLNNTGHENSVTSPNAIGINGNCQHIVISNNVITNGCNGIKTDLRDEKIPSDISINDNIITGNSQNGMRIHSTDNFISNNKISSNGQDGIYVIESENSILNNNVVNNNTRHGIYINQSSHTNINNCIVYDNNSTGIFAGNNSGHTCHYLTVSNCECYKTDEGTQGTGIFIYYADEVKLLSCKSYNNTIDYDVGRSQTTNLVSQLNPSYAKTGVKSLMYSDAIPTNGSYNVGDVVFFTSPTAGGYVGAVCVTAGAPGTWKNFGNISS